MKNLLLVIVIISISGCNTHTMVKNEAQTIKAITVTPTLKWNKVPSMFSVGKVPTWTADGLSLNTISFFSDIKDGKPLIKSSKKEQYPVFKADMLPTELVEMIESTVSKAYQAKILSSGALRPILIGSDDGFEYTFEFVATDELPRKGYIAGVVKDEKLHLIFYQAARLHYYDSLVEDVQNIVSSAIIN